MSTYTGKSVAVSASAATIVERFSDLSKLQSVFDNLDDDQRRQMGEVALEKDAIIIKNNMAGEIRFQVKELSEKEIRLGCDAPMRMDMVVTLTSEGSGTRLETAIDVDLPMFLRPMVGPFIQKAADGMGSLISRVAEADGADADSFIG